MKNYTVIPNITSKLLNSADTYRYTCLTFTPRKNGYTDSTYKQISFLTGESESVIGDFISRLKKTNLVKITAQNSKEKKRNQYHIMEPKQNYRMIKKELLDLDLPVHLKGFLIQLATITVNNTLDVKLSIKKISELVKVSRPTASKYINELIELKLISKIESGYRLSSKYFKIKDEILEIYNTVYECEYLLTEFNNTDWSKIKNVKEYWKSIEGGYRGKKKNINQLQEIEL